MDGARLVEQLGLVLDEGKNGRFDGSEAGVELEQSALLARNLPGGEGGGMSSRKRES